MSMIEKAAKRYKKTALNKPHNQPSKNQNISSNEDGTGEDKTLIMPSSHESDELESNTLDFDLSSPTEAEQTKKTVIPENMGADDETAFPEEDVTSIDGFNGHSIKAKKSKHSNNLHIDLNKLNNDGFLTPKHPDSPLSSIFRMIKRPILNNAKGKGASIVEHPNLIQVTSSFANEGKTYSAINIAISIAMEKDLNVLLIDADIRKPSLAKTFNIDVELGLTDLLSGNVDDMSKVLFNTNIPSLTIMCAGKPHPNGTELLSSDAMNRFIEEVSTRYPNRIIIFDSPPLLQTTESTTLAAHMGQVILVVEAETTLAPQIKKSIEILNNEIVLLLLNKQREKKNDIAYGYGYGY